MGAGAAVRPIPGGSGQLKDLYEIGEIPPLGHVPSRMYAWAIRRERHGPPEDSMQVEVVPTWTIGDDEVLVLVMAAGVNYNGVWAGLGEPISPFDVHKAPFHVAGSDASGIVWAVGAKVKRWKVGDEVIVHCNQDDGDDEECNGGDPMFSPSQRIWGYETPDGSFGQFCRVQSRQLMRRPQHLTWEESACYTLTLATAYRMLFGHAPHTVRPGQNVLIWGASGGLGVQLAHLKQAAAANQFVIDRRVDPCMSELFPWDKIPHAHTKMWRNQHAPGNMAVLVNSPRAGLRTFDDVLELSGSR
ncbi:alcohol dehydrogenase catalytic domain-containing protein [Methylobacterium sp. WSM2598]|uniref:alcohol dehydrogenase catalytic domain-containing protein n=1 Tax=Methylobacterium sp. WSM2598 TaxID=398261 RepID=UPI000364B285|nr:alcohol dehydrogenase catalytic domain-containing protein [Methylobacterium sp. WSM2598]